MSEESATPDLVARARKAFEAVTRGEAHSVLDQYSPDAVFDTAGYGLGTFVGREAIRGFLREWTSSFEDLTVEADEILGLGGGIVLSIYHQEGRPIGATNYVRVRSATISEWLDGVIVRVTIYSDIGEARAAAERLAEGRGGRDDVAANVEIVGAAGSRVCARTMTTLRDCERRDWPSDDVGEPGPCALDLRRLGARRLQRDGVGAPRH